MHDLGLTAGQTEIFEGIRSMVNGGGPSIFGAKNVIQATGAKKRYVGQTLVALREVGLIRVVRRGRWEVV